ncbi:hypothetical protein [Flavobacterium sp.]|uniref:hypothetical protein n=1 Tax=Flavobacterium sp. TaxID=239 RepID=UPI00260535E3|nr:hypothetical protein [Flavobacterium sp.]
MDRLKHILAFTLFLSSLQPIIAQSSTSINELNVLNKTMNESIFIGTNVNTFVTGEALHYKLYCLNNDTNTPSPYSKIAYVELIDGNKKSIFKQKLFLEKGTGNGDFFIPTTLETGNYKIIGYTAWMLNQSKQEFFNIDISVINPYQINLKKNDTLTTNQAVKNQATNNIDKASTNNQFGFDLTTKIYASREIVHLKLNAASDELLNGNYSISVRKTDALASNKQLSPVDFVSTKKNLISEINTTDDVVLPELRGEIISGKITAKTVGNSVENKLISLTISGESFATKTAKTDKNGTFKFNLEKTYANPNLIIQIVEENRDDYSVEMIKLKPANYSTVTINPVLTLNPELKNDIEQRAIASQIENGYYNIKKDTLAQSNRYKLFFDPLSKEYILDKYTRFPTLKETIIEVVEGVYYKNNNDKYTIHLKDYDEKGELSKPSLVIVDGLMIQDLNEFFKYKTTNVYKINIVKGGYYFGSQLFNGLIVFTTKNNDYETKLKGDFIITPEMERPLNKVNYFQPDYTDKTKNSRIPDYRYQLLWLPEVALDNKEQSISFFTSDVTGAFEITLEGFTSKGLPVSIKEVIEVK